MSKTPEEKAAEAKAKLLTSLAEFNITATSGTVKITPLTGDETNEKLAELLKQAKADAKAALKNTDGPVTVKYRDHRGEIIERTFSQEVHGDEFADLAEQFKANNENQCAGLNG